MTLRTGSGGRSDGCGKDGWLPAPRHSEKTAEWNVYVIRDHGDWFQRELDLFIREKRGL